MTAMMALFLVLWISSQKKEIVIATARYFQNPFNSPMKNTSGIMPYDTNKPSQPHGDDSGADKPTTSKHDVDLQYLNALSKDFFRLLNLDEDMGEKPVDIQVTSDGLRITLYDRSKRPLFGEKDAEFTEWGRFVMQSLAWMIDRQKFRVVIEGHTRQGLVFPKPDYTAWELSADRANSARRALTLYAVDPTKVERVTGFADTRPVPFQSPESESNQRITLSLTLGPRGKEKDAKQSTIQPTPNPVGPSALDTPKSRARPAIVETR